MVSAVMASKVVMVDMPVKPSSCDVVSGAARVVDLGIRQDNLADCLRSLAYRLHDGLAFGQVLSETDAAQALVRSKGQKSRCSFIRWVHRCGER